MNLKKIDNIIIFGGTVNVLKILNYLKKSRYEHHFFTSERMLKEIVNEKGTLRKNLKLLDIKYIIEKDINKSKKLIKIIKKNSLGIGVAEPWKFNKNLIKKFNTNLIDYMGIPLPRYRGGAHFTWMILQNEKKNGACFQHINEKSEQGIYDSGDKIEYINYSNLNNKIPIDYFNKEAEIALKIFKTLLHKITNNKKIKYNKINESDSYFLPRLNTKKNGWVNWQIWDAHEITNFINAFSFPYPGASSYIDKNRIFLRNAKIFKKGKYHPFQSGLIVRINKIGLFVIANKAIILIKNYNFENNKVTTPFIGQRLFTPQNVLDESLNFIPSYNSKGLKK